MAVAVVDATALAAVAFDEPEREGLAARLRGPLLAPEALPYELVDICTAKLARDPARRQLILRQFELALDADIVLHPIAFRDLPALCERYAFTAERAAYLWLALDRGATLVTLDNRLDLAHRRERKLAPPANP